MAARQYVQKEWRLLSWWLALRHPNADISMNVRLGAPVVRGSRPGVASLDEPVSRVFQRYADTVFIEDGQPWIVEAKLEPDPGIYSQLIHYARKFRMDPRWAAWADQPLKLVAVVYHDDPTVSIEAPYYRVSWEVFRPDLAVLPPAAQKLLDAVQGEFEPPLPVDWPARLQSWGIKALSGS